MFFKNLGKPYPYTSRVSEALRTVLFISLFIFFFVYLFRVDRLASDLSNERKLLISAYYGLTIFVVAMTNILIFNIIVTSDREQKWRVLDEILLYVVQFVTISIAIHFLSYYVTDKEFSFKGILYSVFMTTVIGSIPVSLHVFNQQKKLFKKHFVLAIKMGEENLNRTFENEEETITIESHTYPVTDLLFFESRKNYLNIILSDERVLRIRFTIKEMENELSLYPQFIRCHRAFIINTNRISKIEGNSQGLKLSVDQFSAHVPVSRSYIPKLDHVMRPTG